MQARPPSSQRLAFIRQSLTELISIRDPATVARWAPTDEQRAHYTTLLWNILDHVDHLRGEGRTRLLGRGRDTRTPARRSPPVLRIRVLAPAAGSQTRTSGP